MRHPTNVLPSLSCLGVLGLLGCGSVGGNTPDAASHHDSATTTDASGDATAPTDAAALGSQANPAAGCVVLRDLGASSGVYWIKDTNGTAFQTYCDQQRNGGGWALVYRSVLTGGQTTAFWQQTYAQRLENKGDPNVGQNFYAGSVYHLGRDYMDLVTDLQDKTVVAAVVATSGILESTMRFQNPVLTSGDSEFMCHFSAGWSSQDYDGDTYTASNCSTIASNVAQHYCSCFIYNLGADGDMPTLDGGVGPHVQNARLSVLGLAMQPNSGEYSRVNAIERYARW